MKLPSAEEMKSFDTMTIKGGISELDLMEQAGTALYGALLRVARNKLELEKPVLILVGPGNNGGDGLVIARLLIQNGYNAQIVSVNSKKYSDCFQQNIERLLSCIKKCGLQESSLLFSFGKTALSKSRPVSISKDALFKIIKESSLVIDALLGIGITGAPKGDIKEVIDLVNYAKEKPQIVSIDLPSGISADDGQVYAPAISATITLTVELIKRGMVQYPARLNCGAIEAVPCGINIDDRSEFALLTPNSAPRIPKRPLNAHKSNFGKVLVIGGSQNMPGAPVLSAISALKSGTGLVYLATPDSARLSTCPSEIMHVGFKNSDTHFKPKHVDTLITFLDQNPIVVIGPGLGQNKETTEFTLKLLGELQSRELSAVIDADALNIISNSKKQYYCDKWIFTPHPGEAARLLGKKNTDIESNRYDSVRELSLKLQGVTILKGASTIIYHKKSGVVNSTGNPYLATAGSGDVLSGLIASLIAQGLDEFDAAKLGVYIHGLSGDRAFSERPGPMIASDIITYLSQSVYELTG